MGDVTPDQIANFDQALADVENNLDVLIAMWRTGDPDSPEHIRIAGLCVALGDSEWDRIAFVEILVAAIRRLDRAGQAATLEPPLMIWRDGEVTPVTAATPDGPRRWALPDDAEVEEQWGACYPGEPVARAKDREGALIFVESLSAYAESRDDAKRAILVKRQAVTTPWEPADATPAADGQDGYGRDG